MTVSATARRAGPFTCNGVLTSFAFSFKVFADADIRVVLATSAGVESDLTLTTNYTVTRNSDQENNPGGTITTVGASSPYATGNTITIVGAVEYTQTADITNSGGFFPEVVENALDRATMLVQQLKELIGRAFVAPASDNATVLTLPTATQRANAYLTFDASGNPTVSAGTASQAVSSVMVPVVSAATLAEAATALDEDLGAIAALTSAADKVPYSTGAGAWAMAAFTAFGRTIVAAADAAAAWAALGITNLIFSTGDAKLTLKTVADTGWVMFDDGTIGNAGSGATTRANADTLALYTLLWNGTADADCAVSTGRGASAAADFTALKTIALPKVLGRALCVAGAGAGLTARALAHVVGHEATQQHNHTGVTGGQSADHTHPYANGNFSAGASWPGTGSVATQDYNTGGASNDHTHSFTTDNFGAGNAGNMQPSTFFNAMVKL